MAATPETAAGVELRRLDPRVRLLWWGSGALGVLPAVVAALVADRILVLPFGEGWAGPGVAALLVLVAAVGPVLRYRRWRWALREHDLWIRRGTIAVRTSVIPLTRLQFVDTRQGPVMRLLGLAELVVHTAAPGTSGVLSGLDQREAFHLREQLAGLAGTDDGL